MLITSERQLRVVLDEYVRHYNHPQQHRLGGPWQQRLDHLTLPHRVVIFIELVGCGILPSIPMRVNRREAIESGGMPRSTGYRRQSTPA